MSRSSDVLTSLAILLAAMASIQGGAALAKSLFPLVGAGGATALRLVLSAAVLMLVLRPWRRPPPRAAWPTIVLYGLSLGAMNLSFYLAIRTIPLGPAVALEFVGPLAVALAGSRRPLDLLWAALAAGGVVMLLPLSGHGALDPAGVALALLAGGFWALYILIGRRAGAQAPGSAVAFGMAAAAVAIAPVGAVAAGPSEWSWAILPLGLAMAILSSALPYSLEMIVLRRLPARTFGVMMSLEPAVGALSGLLFLGERLTAVQTLAVLVVMSASAGAAAFARAPQQTAAASPRPWTARLRRRHMDP